MRKKCSTEEILETSVLPWTKVHNRKIEFIRKDVENTVSINHLHHIEKYCERKQFTHYQKYDCYKNNYPGKIEIDGLIFIYDPDLPT